MGSNLTVLVASGASGGHLFPAIAVAKELQREGVAVQLVLGGGRFAEVVERAELPYVRLPAAAFNDRGVVGLLWASIRLLMGMLVALQLVWRVRPAAVFGTGGYATVALLVAGKLLGVPVVIHEQNVLPGRANRLLARWADVVIVTFAESVTYLPKRCGKVLVLGTPLRDEILALAKVKRRAAADFRLLILGGSQGARILGDVVPEMVALMSREERQSLVVVQQVRPEDMARVKAIYADLELAGFEVAAFFNDLPQRYLQADVVIGRSGVGTVLEAATLGLPAIYVPLELADGHQKLNAAVAERAGAAVVVEQAYFTPASLLVHVRALRNAPQKLEAMAMAARQLANPTATRDVAAAVRGVMPKNIGLKKMGLKS
ncbi:MAG: undecaprenyldiphospho-muramoylpentapeptide beta-N-acetylglucosaminyltransferase [Proteobacteria bacterium]|nr:undecaprenyldiphospho-muramoylpentapeptide beta-N-acetylglucosaminyltransferase [Pseudomonadota bacterium]